MIELKEHNIRPYRELCAMLEKHDKCAYVSATGTGKSYVVGKYIEEHDLVDKTLMLVPSRAIKNGWTKLLPGIKTQCYQGIIKTRPDVTEYELLVCDEIHHLGAEKWGGAFNDIVSNFQGKVIGMTATPVRFLDQCRDMTQEIFNGCVVEGTSLPQAIKKGILPTFEYTTALFSVPRKKSWEETESKTTDKLLKKLQWMENEYSFQNILTKHLNANESHKVAVFAASISELPVVRRMMDEIYPDATNYIINSKMSKRMVEESIEKFSVATGMNVMYSVNMLNEGLHVDGVDTVIMFRKTESPVIYLQQIGRALSADMSGKQVKIFDFVGNHANLQKRVGSGSDIIQWIVSEMGNSASQIIVKDYALEEMEILNKLNNVHVFWTKEEDEILRALYNEENGVEKIMERLPNRNRISINARARKLGISSKKQVIYKMTDELKKDIKRLYGTINGNMELYRKYPEYPHKWISRQANKMGIRVIVNWTPEEDAIIKNNPNASNKKLMEMLPGKSKECIQKRKQKLGTTTKHEVDPWTPYEYFVIWEYSELTALDVQKYYLPHRHVGDIRKQRNTLGIMKRNHKIDKEKFKHLYEQGGEEAIHNTEEFAWMSSSYICVIANRLGAKYKRIRKGWWKDEEVELIKLYLEKPMKERESVRILAEKFPDRTEEAVYGKIKELQRDGVYEKRERNKWTDEEIDLIHEYLSQPQSERGTIKQLAKKIPNHAYDHVVGKVVKIRREREVKQNA